MILKTWHRAVLIFALAAVAMSILAYCCLRDPAINFLPHDGQAEWIVFPTVPDAALHRFASIDTIFEREFVLDSQPHEARLGVRGTKRVEVKINGTAIETAPSRNWKDVSTLDVRSFLRAGQNVIEARVFNHTGPPALWFSLSADQFSLRSDGSWRASLAGSAWRPAALATTPRIPGAGNPVGDSEQTLVALANVWWIWIVLAVVCAIGTYLGYIITRRPRGAWIQVMPVVLVAGLWLILFWNNARLLPYHTGFDSRDHLAYINYVQERKALPLPTEGYEMYQPPLYYIISAAALSVCGLSISDPASVIVLRFLATLSGISQFIFVFLSLRLLFPARIGLQFVGLIFAAFLPMQLYLAHYVTNEMLAAALVTAAIYFALRFLRREDASVYQSAGLGLCIGAAMLTKATAVLLLPVVVAAVASRLASRRATLSAWLRTLGVMLPICFVVCGWYYIRIWLRFGTPILGNWDISSGFAWWQEPGYRTAADYVRFGRSLVSPLFSGFNGVGDGIYSTLWGDGLCGGAAALAYRPPWNYQIMVAGYLLGLIPTGIILAGVALAIRRFIRKPSAELFLLLGLFATVALGLIFMTLRVPSYAQAKAFYGLSVLAPICFFSVLGWETLTGDRRILSIALGIIVSVWGINGFASVWIVRSVSQCLYVAQALRQENKIDIAVSEAAKAVESDPSDTRARRIHAMILDDLNRNDEALNEAARAVELSPGNSASHLQLAISAKQSQIDKAIHEARRAIELGPENSAAYKFLMSCLLESHQDDEAINLAYDWLAVSPFSADVHYALALALAKKGEFVRAANHFGYVMMLRADLAEVHARLREGLVFLTTASEGSKQLHTIASQAPDSPRMLDELAWLFATHPDPNLRDGQEAVHLAQHACILTDRRVPALLDTLAAAYAEAGKFPTAVSTAKEALVLARSSGDNDGVTLSQNILAAVLQHQPYRDEPVPE
ncbi:MAG: tetratricopeptide repeat protein [Verrucomicrobiota bacterium]